MASKAIAMFQKLNVPVLGIIENMSYYVCPHCGHQDEIFGHGGAREAADGLASLFLARSRSTPSFALQSDEGKPVALD